MDRKPEPTADKQEVAESPRQEEPLPVDGALALQVNPQAAAGHARAAAEVRRRERARPVRGPRTISVKRMTKRELGARANARYSGGGGRRRWPKVRSECVEGARPCPFVSCTHHLYLDVSARTGAIKVNFPDLDPWEMSETCALDVSDRGGTTLEEVGAIMNLTRERIRQVEVKGLAKLAALRDMTALRDYVDDEGRDRESGRLPVLAPPKDDVDDDDERRVRRRPEGASLQAGAALGERPFRMAVSAPLQAGEVPPSNEPRPGRQTEGHVARRD